MSFFVGVVSLQIQNLLIQCVVGVVTGVMVYCAMNFAMKNKIMRYGLKWVREQVQ
jgi:hypothetical protein